MNPKQYGSCYLRQSQKKAPDFWKPPNGRRGLWSFGCSARPGAGGVLPAGGEHKSGRPSQCLHRTVGTRMSAGLRCSAKYIHICTHTYIPGPQQYVTPWRFVLFLQGIYVVVESRYVNAYVLSLYIYTYMYVHIVQLIVACVP